MNLRSSRPAMLRPLRASGARGEVAGTDGSEEVTGQALHRRCAACGVQSAAAATAASGLGTGRVLPKTTVIVHDG